MSECSCDRKGQENALICRNASKRLSVTSGVAKTILKPCDCHCHWAPHRDDCEGGENCICQRSPRITTLPALDSSLDSLLCDPDWDDCDKGDAYNALSRLRSQRDELRYRIEGLEREIGEVLSLLMHRSKYFDEADMVFRFARTFDRLNVIAARISKRAKS